MTDNPGSAKRPIEARFAEWVVRARWTVIAGSLILVLLAASGGMFLKFSTNYRIFFSEDNPQLLALEALENTYGKSDNLLFMIVPEDGDATSEQALRAAVWLTERAWQTPYSRRVDSLANFQHTTADGDELAVRDLVDPARLADPQERTRVREAALADPRVAASLLARDGGVSAVQVTVELPEEGAETRVAEIAGFARKLAVEAGRAVSGYRLAPGRDRDDQSHLRGSVGGQPEGLPPREPGDHGVDPLPPHAADRRRRGNRSGYRFSVVASIGLGGWVGLPFTPSTAPAPTIVLMIVVANCVHVLVDVAAAHDGRKHSKREAVVESVRLNLHPVFLASVTTALGFLTMNFSEVPPYRHLGNFVAFGIAASFLLSVTFLPALLSLLPMRAPKAQRRDDPAMAAIAEFVVRRRKALLWGSVGVVLALAAAIPRNDLNDVLVHFFDESVEFRQDTDFLDERLSGNTVLEYSLASSGPGGVTEPAFLADVSAFADWYRKQPETRHVEVITDTFRQLNKSMHGDDPAAYRLPASRELAAQYLLLYELSLPAGLDLNNRIDTRQINRHA